MIGCIIIEKAEHYINRTEGKEDFESKKLE